MAWIVGDSFDYYGSAADMARSVWTSIDTTTCIPRSTGPAPRFGIGQYLQKSTTAMGNALVKNFGNESTLFTVCAHYRVGALSGTAADLYITFLDGATAQCALWFLSNGDLVLHSGVVGAVLATYPSAFTQDVWTHFQLKLVIHNTAGSFTVRKNGAATDTFSATGLNTRGGTANNYINSWTLGTGGGGQGGNLDDLLLYSGSGAAPNDWVGDIRAITLMPTADTATKQFAVFPSGTNAGAVDEALANSDTDYVFDSVVGHEDLYVLDDLPVTPAAVIGVVSKVFVKKSDAGARSGAVRLRSGATDVQGTDTVLGSTYTYLSRVDTTDPATGVAWTPTAVNALQVGQKVTA